MKRRVILILALAVVASPPAHSESDAAKPKASRAAKSGEHACRGEAVSNETLRQLMTELRSQKRAFEQREREIAQRERVADEIARDAEQVLAEIEAVRDAVEKQIKALDEESNARIGKLAKVYSELSPRQAAPLLEELDLDLATAILAKMKSKKSAAVLAQMSKKNALRMSNRSVDPLGGVQLAAPSQPGRTQ